MVGSFTSKNRAETYQMQLNSTGYNCYVMGIGANYRVCICLLYTSDAADERSSVDLGGRRIIKKKKNTDVYVRRQLKNKKIYA